MNYRPRVDSVMSVSPSNSTYRLFPESYMK